MATAITIKGRIIRRPGVYSQIKSGIKNPSLELSYGNVCIIDDGIGAGFGGGAGITGTLTTEAADAVYAFKTIQDFRDFVKGGPLWDIAEVLYKPAGINKPLINGASTVFLIQARETVQGTITKTFTNGTFLVDLLDEGVNGNGVLQSGELVNGYGAKIVPGVLNTAKFIYKIWLGNYRGVDALNPTIPYDSIPKGIGKPSLMVQSPELSTIGELVAWAQNDFDFNQFFRYKSSTITSSGTIVVGDIDTTYNLAVGGTETYTSDAYDKALLQVKNLDNAFFLATKYGADALDLNNFKILDFIQNDAKYEKQMFVGGGYDSTKFKSGPGSSIVTAQTFDSDKVVVVHGGCKKAGRGATTATTSVGSKPIFISGLRLKSQFFKAAAALGRACGLEPQVPSTLKTIGIDAEVHPLTEDDQELALSAGVLYTNYDYELSNFVLGQGINTLQNNEFLVNEDGTSFSIAVKRITGQLNKELIFAAKRRFYGGEEGPNRNTINPQDVKAWLEGFLTDKIASSLNDNLITRFGNVVVTTNQDNVFVNYEFVPNFEVSKMIFTGFILDK